MKEQLEKLAKESLEAVAAAGDIAALDALRVKYLGKKGELTAILKQMGKLSAEERPVMGQLANTVRAQLEEAFDAKRVELEEAALEARLEAEALDVTLPGKRVKGGHKHPMDIVIDELKDIFIGMGFEVDDGPEVEESIYNFDRLNTDEGHPARELIRRKLGKSAYGMTITLLLTSEGKKMGKTQAGAVWLDPNKTSPYDFYQYWRNIDDADVMNCLRKMTFLPLEQIDEMGTWKDAKINEAKDILAWELTSLVHGEEEANRAREGARAVFGGGVTENMPTTELTADDLTDGGIDVLTLLVKTGLCASKSDARRNVQQGGVTANDEKVDDIAKTFTEDELKAGVILRRGKKSYNKALMK